MRADESQEALIRQQAAEWLTRRDAGWSSDEAAEFASWQAADARHEAAVEKIEAAQQLLTRLPESPRAAAMLEELDRLYPPRRVIRFPRWARVALAAAACLAVVVWLRWPSAPGSTSYVAAVGQQRQIALEDGSTLYLNGGSQIEVALARGERRVRLQRGEVHFSVAKDPARPFIVGAETIEIRAVGTAFGVRREADLVEVIVTEGRVRVHRESESRMPDSPGSSDLLLSAGEGARLSTQRSASFPAAPQLAASVRQDRPSWQAPRLEFTHTPLSEVLARFNAFSPVQLELADPELAGRPVGGTFNADQAETFVNLLVAAGDVRVERVSETRILLHKAR